MPTEKEKEEIPATRGGAVTVRLNPRLWNLDAHEWGRWRVTHEPQEVPAEAAETLLAHKVFFNGKEVAAVVKAQEPADA